MDEPTQQTQQAPIQQQEAAPSFSASAIMQRFEAQMADKPAEAPSNPDNPLAELKVNPPVQETHQAQTTQQQEPEQAQEKEKWYTKIKRKADEFDKVEPEYKKLKEEMLPQREKELAELREQVAKMSPVDAEKYQAELRARDEQIKQYEEKVAVFAIEESQEYYNEVKLPLIELAKEVDGIAASYGLDGRQIRALFDIQDPQIRREKVTEALASMDQLDAADIRAAMKNATKYVDKAFDMQNNAVKTKKELEFIRSQKEIEQQATHSKQLKTAAETMFTHFADVLPELTKDEKVAQEMRGIDLTAKLTPEREAYNRMSGKAVFHLAQQLKEAQAKLASAESALAARSSVGVKAGGGQGQQQGDSTAQGAKPVYEGNNVYARARAAGLA